MEVPPMAPGQSDAYSMAENSKRTSEATEDSRCHGSMDAATDKTTPQSVARSQVVPRAPFTFHCSACLKKSILGRSMDISQLTTEFLEGKIIQSEEQLRGRCVFYSDVLPSERPAPNSSHGNLGKYATEYVQRHEKVLIWNAFPGRNDFFKNAKSKGPDFYEVHKPGSWLNHLPKTNADTTYFARMAEALAQRSSGHVVVLTCNAPFLHKYGQGDAAFAAFRTPDGEDWLSAHPEDRGSNNHSVWNDVVLPALRASGKVESITCYEVTGDFDTFTTPMEYTVDMATGRADLSTAKRADHDRYFTNMAACLTGTCRAAYLNMAHQPRNEDWFGTGWYTDRP